MFNWERVQGISGDWENVYYNGYEATINIITTAGQTVMNLNEKPESAAEYCYNKNKRSEGEVFRPTLQAGSCRVSVN